MFRCFINDIHPSTHKRVVILQTSVWIRLSIVERQSFNNLQTKSNTFDGTKLVQENLKNGELD